MSQVQFMFFIQFKDYFQFEINIDAEKATQEMYKSIIEYWYLWWIISIKRKTMIQSKYLYSNYQHGTVIFGIDLGSCHIKSQFYSTLSFKGPSISCKILAFFIVTCSLWFQDIPFWLLFSRHIEL